jgi:hypothetical protein
MSTVTTDNTYTRVFPDAGSWTRNANTVVLTRSFDSFKDMMGYVLKDESYDPMGFQPVMLKGMSSIIDTAGEKDAPLPKEYMSKKFRDTSLGGNDAINCLYQFNEDTDLVHSHTCLGDETGLSGMGRVYSEMIDDKQKIMYMSFGVPNFMGAFKFYKDAIDGELSNMMTDGDIFSVATLGRLFGITAGLIVTLPFLPIVALWKVVNMIPKLTKMRPSKYYDFRETMPLYYKVVNTMLAHLAINMGLVENGGADSKHTGAPNSDKTYDELAAEQAAETNEKSMLGKEGFDIYAILMKKYKYNRLTDTETAENLDDLIDQLREQNANKSFSHYDENEMSWYEKFKQGADSGLRRTLSYIGFRVEKGDTMTESFSNSIGESSLASVLNSKAQAAADAKFSFSAGKTGVGAIDGFTGALKGIFDGTRQAIGIDGLSRAFVGSGKIDIPDVYLDSEFSVSHSFTMSLFAVYKDPITIMRSLYIPLSCIMAGALPRAVGPNAYTSPFICQVHCPGLFSIPMGMIDSLTIARGDSENGWTMDNLPTKLDISFSIKDLSKAMFLTIATDSKWRNVLGQNSSFQEYLLTLSGSGLEERILWTRNLKRRAAITKQVWRQNKLNPYAHGFKFGNMEVAKILSAFRPTYDLGKDVSSR